MKKIFLLFCLLDIMITVSVAQPLTIQWQKCLGGTHDEAGYRIRQTSDGGYLTCGLAISNDGNVFGNHSNQQDGWVVKLDGNGNLMWQRCYGGSDGETFYSLELTSEQGFIVAGTSTSLDGDLVSVYHPGGQDGIWVVDCDSVGGINWQKCFGGSGEEGANEIIQTSDGGYMVIGWTYSTDFDVVGLHDSIISAHYRDTWLLKLDSIGSIEWSKCYGGCWGEFGYSVVQTPDSGFVFVSSAESENGDVQGIHGASNGRGYEDYWIVKINDVGDIQWQKCFGGSSIDTPNDIQVTHDGGFILTGSSASSDFDVSGHHNVADVWVLKLDSVGTIQWQKCLGGSDAEFGKRIIQLIDGGYLTLNATASTDGDLISNPPALVDVWLARLDSLGNILWQQCLGGSSIEEAFDIQLTSDGGCVFSGVTGSNDGDVSGNHGGYDMWVVKLAPLPDGVASPVNLITDFAAFQNNISNTLGLSFYCNGNENVSVQLLDLTGRVLLQQPLSVSAGFNKKQVQTGNISTGVYLVRLATDAGAVLKKLMVQ